MVDELNPIIVYSLFEIDLHPWEWGIYFYTKHTCSIIAEIIL